MIDDVDIDVDGGYGEDGKTVKAFLTLEGDFINKFDEYLNDDDAIGVSLEIPRSVAEQLYKKLGEIL